MRTVSMACVAMCLGISATALTAIISAIASWERGEEAIKGATDRQRRGVLVGMRAMWNGMATVTGKRAGQAGAGGGGGAARGRGNVGGRAGGPP